MLHIINGDSVVHSFRDGGVPGTYLAWRDALHDGAVPMRDTLEELSDVRAHELTRLGVAGDVGYQALRENFRERDALLSQFRAHEEVVLWFEHDLYDQLQLLQILDWFSRRDLGSTRLTMIQIGSHAEVTPFHGLGQLSGRQLEALLPSRTAVTPRQLQIGRTGWEAFCSSERSAVETFAARNDSQMPFLHAALQRLLEEFPADADRLSRIERELLTAVKSGAATREALCLATWKMEPWTWGDTSIYLRLDGLASGSRPAVDRLGDLYSLNECGRRLLLGDAEEIRAREVDTWLGGVHIVIT